MSEVPIATSSRVGARRWLSWSMSFQTPCGDGRKRSCWRRNGGHIRDDGSHCREARR
jgi:hypothetical protein